MSKEELQPAPRDRGTIPTGRPIGSFGASSPATTPAPPTKPVLPTTPDTKRLDGKPAALGAKPVEGKGRTVESVPRLVSLDAFRGFIMLAMASAGLSFIRVFENLKKQDLSPDTLQYKFVEFLRVQTDHVAWTGGVFWDLIQPAFMFMVGVALPYSYARRVAAGESYGRRLLHTLFRSLVLIALGVFLNNPTGDASRGAIMTSYAFANVLAQIGLGYTFVFLFVNRGIIVQSLAIAAICGGTWYAFYQHPLPPEGFDYKTVLPPRDDDQLDQLVLPGLFGHWSKNTNFAAEMDRKILNAFPRNPDPPKKATESLDAYERRLQNPFRFNEGGYATLNFVPAMATMLLGLIIGELLRAGYSSGQSLKRMAIIGAVCIALGLIAGFTVCPIVKRIWTPSWALVSGGIVVWMLAGFYLVFDHWGRRRWAWPLVVVGMNSIVIYMMSQLTKGWTLSMLKTHLTYPYAKFVGWYGERTGREFSPVLFGGDANAYTPMWESAAVLFVFWLVCVWLWKQKIFVKI